MTPAEILAWIDERLDGMVRCPRMWAVGSEALELQALLLLELRASLRVGASSALCPVDDRYFAFLRRKHPLSVDLDLEALAAALGAFIAEERAR